MNMNKQSAIEGLVRLFYNDFESRILYFSYSRYRESLTLNTLISPPALVNVPSDLLGDMKFHSCDISLESLKLIRKDLIRTEIRVGQCKECKTIVIVDIREGYYEKPSYL